MEEEIWKDIKNYESLYQVSNLGRIKSFIGKDNKINGKILKVNGASVYPTINLVFKKIKGYKTFYIHRLVAEAFIPNTEKELEINHIDGNKSNNNVSNLEWVNHKKNIQHSFNTGLHKIYRGKEHWSSKPISQYTRQGEFIKEFFSIKEANRETGIMSIWLCLDGRIKTSGGYKWQYN